MALIEQKLEKRVPADKPRLSIVPAGQTVPCGRAMDPVTREGHVKAIRHLARIYHLQGLLDRSALGPLEDLPDESLYRLRRDLDSAVQAVRGGTWGMPAARAKEASG